MHLHFGSGFPQTLSVHKNLFKIQIPMSQAQEIKTSGSGLGLGICILNKHPGVSDAGGLEK